jgi:hypothetical protein
MRCGQDQRARAGAKGQVGPRRRSKGQGHIYTPEPWTFG